MTTDPISNHMCEKYNVGNLKKMKMKTNLRQYLMCAVIKGSAIEGQPNR